MPNVARIKKFSPLQLGKVLAVVYGMLSLVAAPFFFIFAMMGAFAGAQQGGAPGVLVGLGAGIAMAVMIPVVYTACGFIGGVLGAFVYNLAAKWVGGIEVELE